MTTVLSLDHILPIIGAEPTGAAEKCPSTLATSGANMCFCLATFCKVLELHLANTGPSLCVS